VKSSLELVAGAAEEGQRIDAVLARLPEIGSRARAQHLVLKGVVRVGGSPVPKSRLLHEGDHVTVGLEEGTEPNHEPAEASVPFGVAYEDGHLLVVDKPAGLVVHPGAGNRTGTLAQALGGVAAGGSEAWRPGIVHRLDRDTSGLMVVAKSDGVHRALQDAIRQRAVAREYLALVRGRPPSAAGTIDAALGRDRGDRRRQSLRTDHPREARTHFEVVERFSHTTLLRLRLETGRTHQIRVHLSAIGHPVCGDERYGGTRSGRDLGLQRQFLHSALLRFEHPITRELVLCESKPPVDLRRALDEARRGSAPAGPVGSR